MTMHYQEADPILLGSGELYLGKVNNVEDATEEQIKAALKNVGAIQSGATLAYSNSIQEVKSANRGTLMRFVSEEEIKFNCGVLTWLIDNLATLAPATVETDSETGAKKIKIGGKGNLPINYLRFVHKKKDNTGELVVNIYKAQATNGFSFTFDNENPLVLDYEFSALSDNNGNLCEIIETFEGEAELELTSIACFPNTMDLEDGQTGQVNIIGIYNNDFSKQVSNPAGTTFASDDEAVAKVNLTTGVVSFEGVGSATITATNGDLTDSCEVTCSTGE